MITIHFSLRLYVVLHFETIRLALVRLASYNLLAQQNTSPFFIQSAAGSC